MACLPVGVPHAGFKPSLRFLYEFRLLSYTQTAVGLTSQTTELNHLFAGQATPNLSPPAVNLDHGPKPTRCRQNSV